MSSTVQEDIDAINELLPAAIKVHVGSSEAELWAALFRLHSDYVQGPRPHRTWRDAAIAERLRFSNSR